MKFLLFYSSHLGQPRSYEDLEAPQYELFEKSG